MSSLPSYIRQDDFGNHFWLNWFIIINFCHSKYTMHWKLQQAIWKTGHKILNQKLNKDPKLPCETDIRLQVWTRTRYLRRFTKSHVCTRQDIRKDLQFDSVLVYTNLSNLNRGGRPRMIIRRHRFQQVEHQELLGSQFHQDPTP